MHQAFVYLVRVRIKTVLKFYMLGRTVIVWLVINWVWTFVILYIHVQTLIVHS